MERFSAEPFVPLCNHAQNGLKRGIEIFSAFPLVRISTCCETFSIPASGSIYTGNTEESEGETMIENPYKVLGLEQDASLDDVKKAYRQMAKLYHPDLHPDDPDIHEKMNTINEAYDMLTNPSKYAVKRAQEAAQTQDGGVEIVAERAPASSKTISRPVVEEGDSPEIQQVVALLNGNKFIDAIQILTQIPSKGRNARWYYLSALANQMLGNGAQATEQMHKACQLDPQNQAYMDLLFQFQDANQIFGNHNTKGFPISPLIPLAAVLGFFLGRIFLGSN